jgi:hypothetical protein
MSIESTDSELKVSGKFKPFYKDDLRNIWRSDNTRPWDIFSTDTFRRFWERREDVK